MKKFVCSLLVFVLLFSVCPVVYAEAGVAKGITEEMCHADYWKRQTMTDANEVLMTAEDIRAYNKAAVDGSGTYYRCFGLTIPETQIGSRMFPVKKSTLRA